MIISPWVSHQILLKSHESSTFNHLFTQHDNTFGPTRKDHLHIVHPKQCGAQRAVARKFGPRGASFFPENFSHATRHSVIHESWRIDNWLVVWTPIYRMIIPNIWENKIDVPNHQPVAVLVYPPFLDPEDPTNKRKTLRGPRNVSAGWGWYSRATRCLSWLVISHNRFWPSPN